MILMQQSSCDKIMFCLGNEDILRKMASFSARPPFDDATLDFLNSVSKQLMTAKEAKAYPDIVTLGFWLRKSSLLQLKESFERKDGHIHLGRGVIFHIAPSNVPVNYAYSLAVGLLTGNANIVRIPSKNFPQIEIINKAIEKVLSERAEFQTQICLVRYERSLEINKKFSDIADVRIIWGGDNTIEEIRRAPLNPRAGEITFADRYSLAVIDSDYYMDIDNKERVAEDFYNDTYLTDQNACTSPRLVVWLGKHNKKAKEEFWGLLHKKVKGQYAFQPIQGINKLTSSYLMAVRLEGTRVEKHNDNLLVRVKVPELTDDLMKLKDNSGYFLEYECQDVVELKEVCDNTHCQTIGFLGDAKILYPLLKTGIKGVDRIVPIGKTMDFNLLWDGYDLTERLTRTIYIADKWRK